MQKTKPGPYIKQHKNLQDREVDWDFTPDWQARPIVSQSAPPRGCVTLTLVPADIPAKVLAGWFGLFFSKAIGIKPITS